MIELVEDHRFIGFECGLLNDRLFFVEAVDEIAEQNTIMQGFQDVTGVNWQVGGSRTIIGQNLI